MEANRQSGDIRGTWKRRAGRCVVAALLSAQAAFTAAAPDDLAGPADLPLDRLWERRALNALLVPLLEPDGPLAWAAPHELMPCRDSAPARVEGGAVPSGKALAAGKPVVVRFQLHDCWPLGPDWIGLTGTLDIRVVHDGVRLVATVLPVDLSGAVHGARVPLRHNFTGALSLAGATKRP